MTASKAQATTRTPSHPLTTARNRRSLRKTAAVALILAAASAAPTVVLGFVMPSSHSAAPLVGARRPVATLPIITISEPRTRMRYANGGSHNADDNDDTSTTTKTKSASSAPEQVLDDLLDAGELRKAVTFLQQQQQRENHIDMDQARWKRIFDAIERHTSEAEENTLNEARAEDYPPFSPARHDMTDMYEALQSQEYLKLYGAVQTNGIVPAAGSHTVTPKLLETITNLSMTALTPRPTNTLLLAGGAVAVLEGLLSLSLGINFNFLVVCTLAFAFIDRLVLNGAVIETVIRILSPGMADRIARHEAGHFLCAYLLGCPVEGYVLSAWAALQDARFDKRQVSAGTSFFDPRLSREYAKRQVTRSSVDRYSVIVMGGIAAEAAQTGRADGGAGDEMALIYFLSQLNQRNEWNDATIRNQARWGALQAVLLLQYYKPCYEALVDALQRGGSLGDCIFAIEKAGREHNLKPLDKPLGYIVDQGPYGTWTTEPPVEVNGAAASMEPAAVMESAPMDEEASLQALQGYRKEMEDKLRDIDERLNKL